MHVDIIDLISVLVSLAAFFSLINTRFLKLPNSIGLMFIGLMVSLFVFILGFFFPHILKIAQYITEEFDFKDVLFHIILNFLLFSAAININLRKFSEESGKIFFLSLVGIVFSTTIIGLLMFYILPLLQVNIDLKECFLFGAILSPTDPVTVQSLIKKFKLSIDVETIIGSESLLNNGIGILVFLSILKINTGELDILNIEHIAFSLIQEIFGGIFLGVVMGYACLKFLRKIDNDHVEIEILLTVTIVIVASRIGNLFEISGTLAVIMIGLFVGSEGKDQNVSSSTGIYVYRFWYLIDEALISILYILVGFEIIILIDSINYLNIGMALLIILLVFITRYITIFFSVTIINLFKQWPYNMVSILTWGGIKGPISIALALYLPDTLGETKKILLFCTYFIVVFSMFIQGFVLRKILNKNS
ncbi:MAG: sodium:proton antiporter [Chitinophagaceae bacterium]|nr:sodium:proton antiporter [Chitinophagaceae bacterium]